MGNVTHEKEIEVAAIIALFATSVVELTKIVGAALQLVIFGHDQMTLERLELDQGKAGRWTVDLGLDETAVLVVSGRTRVITEPAEYWSRITTDD